MQNSCLENKIKVKASKSYEVVIGRGIIDRAGEYLKSVLDTCKIAIITDDIVDKLYGNAVETSLLKNGYSVIKYVFTNGEESKNLDNYQKILNFLAENQMTRTDAIIALGGGVTGDMAGFVSATYLRGIKCVQIPTTLLAQIDSSVGGKTAVDLQSGKNLVGAFFQPEMVLCDIDTLKTLPETIFKDGMGEVAKYAVLDKKIFNLIKKDDYDMQDLIYLCVDYKRKVVVKDEFEKGVRKYLNLGHTPAHGIEKLSNYTIPHGKAVGMGLNIILNASLKHGFVDKSAFEDIKFVINKCVGENECPYDIREICTASLSDKKRSGGYITLVMINKIGKVKLNKININDLWGYLS